MHRLIQPVWQRLGRRGSALLFFGLLDVVYSYSLLNPPADVKQTTALRFVGDIMPLWAWAAAWAIPAVLCLWQAWTRNDRAAFAAAIAIKILWGTIYLIGWLAVGLDRAYVSMAVWWALAGFVAIISSWPEVPDKAEEV